MALPVSRSADEAVTASGPGGQGAAAYEREMEERVLHTKPFHKRNHVVILEVHICDWLSVLLHQICICGSVKAFYDRQYFLMDGDGPVLACFRFLSTNKVVIFQVDIFLFQFQQLRGT